MNAAIAGRHTRRPGRDPRSWFAGRRRKGPDVPESAPRGPHPYPPADADITRMFAALPSVSPRGGKARPLGLHHPQDGDLQSVVTTPAPASGAWAKTTPGLLRDLRAGLLRMDGPPAWLRRGALFRQLTGTPVFLGLAPAAEGQQLAEISLGTGLDGQPDIHAVDLDRASTLIMVYAQARDALLSASEAGAQTAGEGGDGQ